MGVISLDCESTGLSVYHGCRPYAITVCREDGTHLWAEAPVDPRTRRVEWDAEDLEVVWAEVRAADRVVGHHLKFDCGMLLSVLPAGTVWPWEKCEDTLILGHLLASNQRHNLTDMTMQYLQHDIEPLEQVLEEACKAARRKVQQAQLKAKRGKEGGALERWRIAAEGLPEMPGAKGGGGKNKDGKLWKADGWLPRTLAFALGLPEPEEGCGHVWDGEGTCKACGGHHWHVVLREYTEGDSAATLRLWQACEAEMRRRGLEKLYREQMRLPPILLDMERRGVTQSRRRTADLEEHYRQTSEAMGCRMLDLAAEQGHDLQLPNGASVNVSLRTFLLDVLQLEPVYSKKSKTASPTLDKSAMAHYQATLDPGTKALEFVDSLLRKRQVDTSLGYLAAYRRFGLPVAGEDDLLLLHPNINQTGTDTLRKSSDNPNAQNFSKKKDKEGRSLRHCLGPGPGREWWSLDAQNIELRIPAYASGEPALVAVFDRPDDPPYYGSYHLVVFDALHPRMFAEHGKACKDMFEDTWYQWVKNGNFALIYGCGERTADATYHVSGAYRLLQERFPKIAELSQAKLREAERWGYVTTLPDRTVDPEHGYPLLVARSEWGKVLPTTPLNYFVQGTACWWARRAQVKCQALLDAWAADGYEGRMVLDVHDEIVFDLPKRADPRTNPKASNLARVRKLQAVMASCGDDIGVPITVAAEWNPENWGEGVRT